jgi:hypothetical protein
VVGWLIQYRSSILHSSDASWVICIGIDYAAGTNNKYGTDIWMLIQQLSGVHRSIQIT